MYATSITLHAELERFVRETVASGNYAGPNELIVAALYSFRDQFDLDSIKLERLRRDIAVGIQEADNGEVDEWDVDAFLAARKTAG
jgi:antitoxin ParD1/3/4